LFKKFLRSDRGQSLIAGLAAAYMWVVFRTTRWDIRGEDVLETLDRAGGPYIVCFWHQRMFMLSPIWRRRRAIRMLISPSRDGRLISKAIAHWGIGTLEGSSNRGATSAMRGLLGALKDGIVVGITPDGPRGPARKAAPGLAAAALMASVPVVVATFSARGKFFGSWDRFLLPYPFGRGAIIIERLPPPAAKSDLDAFTHRLETALDAICAEADRIAGMQAA
jgi:lysophospholipid acyltransferase (LPLAT)-like uncharacterized protein